jgi:hypothetical protein
MLNVAWIVNVEIKKILWMLKRLRNIEISKLLIYDIKLNDRNEGQRK